MEFYHSWWKNLPSILMVLFISSLITLDQNSHLVRGHAQIPTDRFRLFARCIVSPNAMRSALVELRSFLAMEERYVAKHRRAPRVTHAFSFVQNFLGSSGRTHRLSLAHHVQKQVIKNCMLRTSVNGSLVRKMYPYLSAHHVLSPDQRYHREEEIFDVTRYNICPYPKNIHCSVKRRFRTFSGRCNNLVKPNLGASFTPLKRLRPPQYADGVDSPRAGWYGDLPTSREVSRHIHQEVENPSVYSTMIAMHLGQFIDHDMDRTAISAFGEKDEPSPTEDIDCGKDGCQTTGEENVDCFPIPVKKYDPLFGRTNKCLMFVRSAGVPNAACTPGPREQLNQLTSFLDAGNVYGSTIHEANRLRDLRNSGRGQLLMQKHPRSAGHKDLLPPDHSGARPGQCEPSTSAPCFMAGDTRANEQPGLACIHTVFAREHNRLENLLHYVNPQWDGERLFQESRRLVIAQWQHVVYNEYLPIVLGKETLRTYGLAVHSQDHHSVYERNVDPSIANVFATAAYRFGHSQIKSMLKFIDGHRRTTEEILLSQALLKPDAVYDAAKGGLDNILRGMFDDSAETVDPHITKQVSGHLFSMEPPHKPGTDLPALNMQRARDHGIEGYVAWREHCGFRRPKNFAELLDLIPKKMVKKFQELYRHVEDIDLFAGGMAELHVEGGMVGPTFACIIADQFRRIKYGDRFWYENRATHPYPFTKAQLASIKETSFARLLCQNSDKIEYIQPRVMLHPFSKVYAKLVELNLEDKVWNVYPTYNGQWNDRVPCSTLADVDINLWKEY